MEKQKETSQEKDRSMPHYRTPMVDKLEVLQERGFDQEFQITEQGLKSISSGKIYKPEEVILLENHRFEGITNPDDMAIVYVIKTKDGKKGTVVDAYGLYSNDDLGEFMSNVENKTHIKCVEC